MNIGIIVFSFTGNTASVAVKLKRRLKDDGHDVVIEKLELKGDYQPGRKVIEFSNQPDLTQYEALIFASAVEAFSLSPVLTTYLKQINSLDGKKTAGFVTQFFPFPWMGGNRALKQMRAICQSKDAAILGTGVVNWKNETRRKKTTAMTIEHLSRLF